MNFPIRSVCSWILFFLSGFILFQNSYAQPTDAKVDVNSFFSFDGLRYNDSDQLFTQKFLRDSTYIEEYTDDSNQSWSLTQRVIFTYNNQGKRVEEFRDVMLGSSWVPLQRTESEYTNDQFLEVKIISDWNEGIKEYQPVSKENYYYNYVGLISEKIIDRKSNTIWIHEALIEYSYNYWNALSEEVSYDWDDKKNLWNRSKRILFAYSSSSQIISETHQEWSDSLNSWQNDFIREFEYNDSNKLIRTYRKKWDSSIGQWIAHSIEAIYYNEVGMLSSSEQIPADPENIESKQTVQAGYSQEGNLENLLYLEWDEETDSWKPSERQTHFWSKYITGNLSEETDEIQCFFANPYKPGLPWYCISLKDNLLYDLEVYDLQGRLYHRQQFRGGDTFRVNALLRDGLYVFKVSGGLDLHSEKVYIRN